MCTEKILLRWGGHAALVPRASVNITYHDSRFSGSQNACCCPLECAIHVNSLSPLEGLFSSRHPREVLSLEGRQCVLQTAQGDAEAGEAASGAGAGAAGFSPNLGRFFFSGAAGVAAAEAFLGAGGGGALGALGISFSKPE